MKDEVVFWVAITVIMTLGIGGCGYMLATRPTYECSWETVQKIGACNEDGYCGVVTDHGVRSAYLPIAGEKVCVMVLKGE